MRWAPAVPAAAFVRQRQPAAVPATSRSCLLGMESGGGGMLLTRLRRAQAYVRSFLCGACLGRQGRRHTVERLDDGLDADGGTAGGVGRVSSPSGAMPAGAPTGCTPAAMLLHLRAAIASSLRGAAADLRSTGRRSGHNDGGRVPGVAPQLSTGAGDSLTLGAVASVYFPRCIRHGQLFPHSSPAGDVV